jgi:hypothetical protein
MGKFIAVVGWTKSTLDKYQGFDTLEEAEAHCKAHGGFAADMPDGKNVYWVVDGDDKKITYDKKTADAEKLEKDWEEVRTTRNVLLTSSDWTVSNDTPLSDEDKAKWVTYRKSLRDLPSNTADPLDVTWPESP